MDTQEQNFRALVVYSDESVTAPLVSQLGHSGVSADAAHTAAEAVSLLERNRYHAVLLEDNLPKGASLQVFELLSGLGERAPQVVMVGVPKARLAEARRHSDDSIEYVATPESQPEVERLALRTRSRLVRAGLSQDFAAGQRDGALAPAGAGAEAGAGGGRRPGVRDSRPWRAIIAAVAILLVLFLALRLYQQAEGPAGRTHVSPDVAVWAVDMNPVAWITW